MSKGDNDQPTYPIGSVDKALRLVIMVAEHPSGMRIGDAAAALGVAPSTAHRLLQMLVLHGFACQDPETRAYRPGPTLDRLRDQRERVRQLARPVLARLVAECEETVHLAVLDGWSAVTLVTEESPHILRVGNREGNVQPAPRSAMGRVLLSETDGAVIADALLSAGVDPDRFNGSLDDLRADGYLLQHGELEPGVSALAVPVRGEAGSVAYAIGITYPTGRIPEDQLARVVEAAKTSAVQLQKKLHR